MACPEYRAALMPAIKDLRKGDIVKNTAGVRAEVLSIKMDSESACTVRLTVLGGNVHPYAVGQEMEVRLPAKLRWLRKKT
jgi:hypothetical protein